jgi:hypothetical protein
MRNKRKGRINNCLSGTERTLRINIKENHSANEAFKVKQLETKHGSPSDRDAEFLNKKGRSCKELNFKVLGLATERAAAVESSNLSV